MHKTAAFGTAHETALNTNNTTKLTARLAAPILALLPIATAVVCVAFGRYGVSVSEMIQVFFAVITGQKDTVDPTTYTVLINLRLPRVILAILCGAGLSVSGTAFQSLFANPLATPDTIGVAAGASFGAALGLLLGKEILAVQLLSILFGLSAVLLTGVILRGSGLSNTIMVILSGIMISSLFNALISLVKFTADSEEQLPSITYWLMGSLASSNYKSLMFCAPLIIIGMVVIFMLRWRLNILCLTDDEAHSQGVNLPRLRLVVIVCATMITASCVAMCGQVGWVGLLIPHICRMAFGSNTSKIVPASISFGAVFMLIIDTVARSMSSVEIPVSVLTAIIGAPFFIILLKKTGGAAL